MIHPQWRRQISTIDTVIRKAGYETELYELDFSLWELLRALTQNNPRAAIESFGLSPDTASNLAAASDKELTRLSSGLILSFGLKTSEEDIVRCLDAAPRTLPACENISYLDLTYWMLLSRVGGHDAIAASQFFGVSPHLAERLATASSSQIRHLVSTVSTIIKLRFDPILIDRIIHGSGVERSIAAIKKIQQSLAFDRVKVRTE